ncbi:MAG: aminoacyl-tRNA hydrolase [Acutalibacteraceae bacterium]|jgi:PTH1 family peptidyl-tRNA hydrolase
MFFKKKPVPGPVDFLIAGLGNPGKKYEATRHNAGFIALEALARELGAEVKRIRFKSYCGECQIGDKRVLLMMPQTMMNASGEAVTEAMRFYKLPPEQVLVLLDDVSLPVGTIRIRRKGSDAGQKGMRSIITLSGSDQFPRIKIGIGEKPHPDYDLAAWVLSKFTKEEQPVMVDAAKRAAEAACLIAAGQIDEAMNRFSR